MLILSFACHVNQFDASKERLCTPKRFESQHRPYPPFHIPVVLLNKIIQLLTLPDSDSFFISFPGIEIESGQRCCIGSTFINGNDLRFAVMTNGLAKEAQGCSSASRLAISKKSMV